jgi:hypothetical protein
MIHPSTQQLVFVRSTGHTARQSFCVTFQLLYWNLKRNNSSHIDATNCGSPRWRTEAASFPVTFVHIPSTTSTCWGGLAAESYSIQANSRHDNLNGNNTYTIILLHGQAIATLFPTVVCRGFDEGKWIGCWKAGVHFWGARRG